MSHSISLSAPVSDADSVSTTVLTAVAATTDTPVTELPPLYSVVDPDALDVLFASARQKRSSVRVSFPYAGYRVDVVDGTVTITGDA